MTAWIAFLWTQTSFPLIFYAGIGLVIFLGMYQVGNMLERWKRKMEGKK